MVLLLSIHAILNNFLNNFRQPYGFILELLTLYFQLCETSKFRWSLDVLQLLMCITQLICQLFHLIPETEYHLIISTRFLVESLHGASLLHFFYDTSAFLQIFLSI